MWLKLTKDISGCNLVVLGMKTSGETFKQPYFSELVFFVGDSIFFSFALKLCPFYHNIFTSNDFFNLWEETSSNCKPYFVTVSTLYSNLFWFVLIPIFIWRKNEIVCKSPTTAMLILILIFQPRTERLTMTATWLLYLILMCLTFCFFIFFWLLWTHLQLQPSCNHFQIFILGK